MQSEGQPHLLGDSLFRARKETEPWEIIYFKFCKGQLPVVEQALETTALMLGSDKSRGYCLEMICADFLAGSATQENQSEVLVLSLERLYQTLPEQRKMQLAERIDGGPWGACVKAATPSSEPGSLRSVRSVV